MTISSSTSTIADDWWSNSMFSNLEEYLRNEGVV